MSISQKAKLKILVCEADSRVLKRLESWILAMGEDVFATDDAMTAAQIFDDENPDILLVSQNIKNMGVIEFIDSIKSTNPTQAVVLMLNNDSENHIFKRSIDLQVDKYLNMPVDASLLFSVLEALSKEKIWHEEFRAQKRTLQDYKDAIDKSFSVSKHNADGKIFFVNESFCTATRLTYDEALEGHLNPLQNTNADMNALWSELNKNNIYRDRQTFIQGENSFMVDVTAVALKNDLNEIFEILVFSNDVTDVVNAARKIKEQELDKKIQKLEHKKELNKVKDTFLTVFSHELKTPLNSIINFSEYIKKHLQKAEFKKRDVLVEQIAQINTSGWHMLDMINNLLDSMKFRDGNVELVKTNFLLNSVVDDILFKYEHALQEIKLIKLFKTECMLDNDREKVSQIVDNLISNAVKYSKDSIGIIIKSNETEFVLEILDDGEGFKDTTKVFGLFEQSDEDNMTRTAEGTGVGLFVVKKICDAMDYEIELCKSKHLGGARVIIKGKKG